jgi:hypothetical protein
MFCYFGFAFSSSYRVLYIITFDLPSHIAPHIVHSHIVTSADFAPILYHISHHFITLSSCIAHFVHFECIAHHFVHVVPHHITLFDHVSVRITSYTISHITGVTLSARINSQPSSSLCYIIWGLCVDFVWVSKLSIIILEPTMRDF